MFHFRVSTESKFWRHPVLSHTDEPIGEPLTTLPSDTLKKEALKMFKVRNREFPLINYKEIDCFSSPVDSTIHVGSHQLRRRRLPHRSRSARRIRLPSESRTPKRVLLPADSPIESSSRSGRIAGASMLDASRAHLPRLSAQAEIPLVFQTIPAGPRQHEVSEKERYASGCV